MTSRSQQRKSIQRSRAPSPAKRGRTGTGVHLACAVTPVDPVDGFGEPRSPAQSGGREPARGNSGLAQRLPLLGVEGQYPYVRQVGYLLNVVYVCFRQIE